MSDKANPVDDDDARRAWSMQHTFCQACGLAGREAERRHLVGLTTHHVIKPGRSDEPCNLLRLCQTCHDLAELRTVKAGGKTLPTLGWRVCLTIKAAREPGEWNPARLRELMRHNLEAAPIPPEIELAFRNNRPWDKGRHWSGQLPSCDSAPPP